MLKTIILVRHGKTQSDKSNPLRKLTAMGRMQINLVAEKLKTKIGDKNAIIISTYTKRARQSARILAKALKLNVKETQINLRVNNFDLIEKKYPNAKNPVFLYFEDFNLMKLDKNVGSPVVVAKNFLKLVGKFDEEILILVGHGAGLESIVKYQSVFVSTSPLIKELSYGEFIVLERAI